jgi:hypothetical protein
MNERRPVAEMIAETWREIGVLVLVFGMLDKFVHDETPSIRWAAWVISIGLFFLLGGYIIERRR